MRKVEVITQILNANDVTARDLQRKDVQFTRAKGFDTFCPVGPWIETELQTGDLAISCTVSGVRRQDGRTRDMVFDVPTLVSASCRKRHGSTDCPLRWREPSSGSWFGAPACRIVVGFAGDVQVLPGKSR